MSQKEASASSSHVGEQARTVSFTTRLLSGLIHAAVCLIGRSVRLRVENDARTQAVIEDGDGVILVTWHGRSLLPIYRYRNKNYCALISLSRDGDLQAENFRRFGFRLVRGSTGRRGVQATREILQVLRAGGVLTFTPDGPRGPSGKAQPGVVYFAQRTGRPIIPLGVSAFPRWRLGTWDRYLIPKPFARALWIYGEPIFVGPDDDLEHAARRVEEAITALEAEAERGVVPTARRFERKA